MKVLIVSVLVMVLAACSSTPRQINETYASLNTEVDHLKIKYQKQPSSSSNYLVLIQNNSGVWAPVRVSLNGGYMERAQENQEVIYISHDFKHAGPSYETLPKEYGSDFLECTYFETGKDTGSLSRDLWTKRQNKGYGPCTSNLVKTNKTLSVVRGLIALPTLGASLSSPRSIDTEKVKDIIRQAELISYVKREKKKAENSKWLRAYRADFERANDTYTLGGFIHLYQNNDPEGLVPIARQKYQVAQQREKVEKQKQLAAAEERRLQQEKLRQEQEERRMFEIEMIKAKAKVFRKSIKIGTQTNCGPVIDVRGNMAKIYTPVSNYGNEHWLMVDQVYQPGVACKFYNGRYVEPRF